MGIYCVRFKGAKVKGATVSKSKVPVEEEDEEAEVVEMPGMKKMKIATPEKEVVAAMLGIEKPKPNAKKEIGEKGSAKSGNYAHRGIPGHVGGSAPKGGAVTGTGGAVTSAGGITGTGSASVSSGMSALPSHNAKIPRVAEGDMGGKRTKLEELDNGSIRRTVYDAAISGGIPGQGGRLQAHMSIFKPGQSGHAELKAALDDAHKAAGKPIPPVAKPTNIAAAARKAREYEKAYRQPGKGTFIHLEDHPLGPGLYYKMRGMTDAEIGRVVSMVEKRTKPLPRDPKTDFPSFTVYKDGEEIGGG